VLDHPQHGHPLLPAARVWAAVAKAGEYAGGLTGSTIHNFRSYLVFAFDAYTSLETLSENLRDINTRYDSRSWIDIIMVLDKGVISYVVQQPFDQRAVGWFGGSAVPNPIVPPYYVILVRNEVGAMALNHFYVRLMSHLTFFRQRSTIDFDLTPGVGRL
jgi:hypothetical protein